jgi:predicted ATPase
LLFALFFTSLTQIFCGNYATATKEHDELIALADEIDSLYWKALCTPLQGFVFALTGKSSHAVERITSGIAALRSAGTAFWMPLRSSYLATAYGELGRYDDAWRSIDQAMQTLETTKERWFEPEANRMAGEIALRSPKPDPANAQSDFERALAVARQQQAKSWELRAATSLARLWRGQGKVQEAREQLAPVYGWFTEGFETRDLQEARAMLNELQ